MQITIYSKRSGVVLSLKDVPAGAVRLQTAGRDDIAHIEGWWTPDKYRIERGRPVEIPAAPPAEWQVRQEAARRIESRYPTWRQLNIIRAGQHDEQARMGAYIDAVRLVSNSLTPAPDDYQDDRHWPAPPAA